MVKLGTSAAFPLVQHRPLVQSLEEGILYITALSWRYSTALTSSSHAMNKAGPGEPGEGAQLRYEGKLQRWSLFWAAQVQQLSHSSTTTPLNLFLPLQRLLVSTHHHAKCHAKKKSGILNGRKYNLLSLQQSVLDAITNNYQAPPPSVFPTSFVPLNSSHQGVPLCSVTALLSMASSPSLPFRTSCY